MDVWHPLFPRQWIGASEEKLPSGFREPHVFACLQSRVVDTTALVGKVRDGLYVAADACGDEEGIVDDGVNVELV